MEHKDTVVLVTGGAHGIGRALCRAFTIQGAQVAVADLEADQAEKVASEIGGLPLKVDVSKEEEMVAAIEKTEKELGPIDILVSNAGVGFGDGEGGAAAASNDAWKACLDVNLMAHVYAARAMIPRGVSTRIEAWVPPRVTVLFEASPSKGPKILNARFPWVMRGRSSPNAGQLLGVSGAP